LPPPLSATGLEATAARLLCFEFIERHGVLNWLDVNRAMPVHVNDGATRVLLPTAAAATAAPAPAAARIEHAK
jgi:hypothetical protein